MKSKRIITAVAVIITAVSVCLAPAFAADRPDGTATFDGKTIKSDFSSSKIAKTIGNLQPGDSASFAVDFKNASGIDTDWYMINEVLDSLEDLNSDKARNINAKKAPADGAYTYSLVYVNDSGKKEVLFSNDTVGGKEEGVALKGLHQATNATGKFFYIDSLKPGQKGTILLSVKLDGQTEANSYMDTDAKIKVSFAVEKKAKPGNPSNPPVKTPKTGDAGYLPALLTFMGGLILLALCVLSFRKDRKGAENE